MNECYLSLSPSLSLSLSLSVSVKTNLTERSKRYTYFTPTRISVQNSLAN